MDNACDANRVIGIGTDRPGNVCTVTALIHGVTIVAVEVIAVDVIDKAIAIIIDTVTSNFTKVSPHIVGQIRMIPLNALIDDCNNEVGIACLNAPGFHNVHIGVGNTGGSVNRLAGVFDGVDQTIILVIGRYLNQVIGLGIFDKRKPRETVDRATH